MPLLKKKTILFDLNHDEMLDIYDSEFSEFLNLLQRLNVTIKKTDNGDIIKDISNTNIDILVIGNPINNYFSNIEIRHVVDFVSKGGNLLLISEYGADFLQKTNLNDLAFAFGIHFEKNIVKEKNKINQNCSSILAIQNFQKHKITNNLREIVIGGTCSIVIKKNSHPLLVSNGGTWTENYNGTSELSHEEKEKKKEPETPVQIIASFSEYGRGRILSLGDVDLFTNQFFNQMDNRKFIVNMLNWLIEPVSESDVMFWVLSQVGAINDEMGLMNNKINNIIETLTIFEERISRIENNSSNSGKIQPLEELHNKQKS